MTGGSDRLSRGAALGRRARALLAGCALGTAVLAGASPASAEWYIRWPWGHSPFFGEARMPPRAVVASLQRRGFNPMGRPRSAGSTYVVDARNPRGDRVRLVVDAYDGQIIDRARVAEVIVPPRDVGPDPLIVDPAPLGPMPPEMGEDRPEPRGAKKAARLEPRLQKAPKPLPSTRPADAAPASPAEVPAAPVPTVKTPDPEPVEAARSAPLDNVPGSPGEQPKPGSAKPEPAPVATAAVTAGQGTDEPRPAAPDPVPAAPAPAWVEPPAPTPPASAESGSGGAPHRSVRVIGGVTPVRPHEGEPAKPEASHAEPVPAQ